MTIRNPVSPLGVDESNSTKTGLINIRERLALLYGECASLETGVSGGVFTAKLIAPKES